VGRQLLSRLVLSHLVFDHAGGAPAILRIFRPRHLWLAIPSAPHPLLDLVRAAAQAAGVETVTRHAGERWESGGVTWRVLHPLANEHVQVGTAKHSNDDSLVLHAQYKAASVLFTGDIHQTGEQAMLSRGGLIHADVLKVAHHGSRTSTGDGFLDTVSPSVALVSVGWLNSHGHPNAAVVERLASRGVALFRTDRDGAITLRTDGRRWRYEAAR